LFAVVLELALDDSIVGTCTGTCTTVEAFVGIDYIDIALRDSLSGALTDTRTASNALVCNNVSHGLNFLSL
jgi:hypothetical protein